MEKRTNGGDAYLGRSLGKSGVFEGGTVLFRGKTYGVISIELLLFDQLVLPFNGFLGLFYNEELSCSNVRVSIVK